MQPSHWLRAPKDVFAKTSFGYWNTPQIIMKRKTCQQARAPFVQCMCMAQQLVHGLLTSNEIHFANVWFSCHILWSWKCCLWWYSFTKHCCPKSHADIIKQGEQAADLTEVFCFTLPPEDFSLEDLPMFDPQFWKYSWNRTQHPTSLIV